MPGRLVFYTSADGSHAPTERLRINSSGQLIQRYSADPYNNRAATFQSGAGVDSTYIAVVNTETNGASGVLFGDHAGQDAGNFTGYIQYLHQSNDMKFFTNGGHERFKIGSGGDATVTDGNLVIGTAGHGIDFSATGNESAMTSELLDTYEEGSFTPTLTNGPSISQEEGRYIRIGKVVHCWWRFVTSNDGPAAHCRMHLPFTSNSDNNGPPNGGTAWDYHTSEVDAHLSQGSNAIFFYQATAALNGDNAQIESEDFRGCTTYEVA